MDVSVSLSTRAEGAGESPEETAAPHIRTLRAAAGAFLEHPSPRIIATKLVIVLVLRAWLAHFALRDAVVVGVVVALWPLQEWLAHIYLLHSRPRRLLGRTLDLRVARIHREHHRRPWDIDTAFLPPRFLLLAAIPINVVLWLGLASTTGVALTGIAAVTACALVYEWTHFLTHTGYRPRSRYYARIWRNHRLHHFKNERYWHSFTMPLVDQAFGTAPEPKDVEQSRTCRTLGMGTDDELGTRRD